MPDYRFQINTQLQETMRRHAENIAKMYEPMLNLQNLPAFQKMQETARRFSKIANKITFENQETMRRFAEFNNQPGLKAFSEQLRLVSEQFNAKFDFDHVVTPHISQLLTTIDWESIPNDVLSVDLDRLNKTEIYDEIERKFNEKKTGYSGKQFLSIRMASFIVQLFILYFAIQTYLSDNGSKIVSESELTNDLLESIEGYIAKADSIDETTKVNADIFLEVKREAPLRLYPDASADSILTVFPGQYLDLIDETKRWYKVQFVNFENGDFGTGWIYKGHVEEIRGEE